MQRSQVNDVVVYNLSGQKTLPEWLNDKQRRKLLKNDDGVSLWLPSSPDA